MKEFKEFSIYSNWGYFDQLDGKNLKNGEKIEVCWPDGSIEHVSVVTKRHEDSYYDHGSPTMIPTVEAFALVGYRGVTALVRLIGSGVTGRRL